MAPSSTTVQTKTSGYWYDEATHTYGCGDTCYPSVTQVLHATGRLDDTWYTEDACRRGRLVHEACAHLDLCGRIVVPDGLSGYVDGYVRFLETVAPQWDAVEVARWSQRLRLAGRPDRIGRIFGVPTIVEIKTGQRADWHDLQTAGYQLLKPTGARLVVYLPGDGTYSTRPCLQPSDLSVFLEALNRVHQGGGQ